MTPSECADFLEMFNKWRRGDEIPMPDPKEIGDAIDFAIKHLRGEK